MADDVIRCPECGRAVDDRSFPKPDRPLHWRIIVPAFVPALLLIGVLIWAGLDVHRYTSGSGTPRTYFIQPPFTRSDIERIASGQKSDRGTSLIEAIRRVPSWPGDAPAGVYILSGFFAPETELSTSCSFGWPSTWYSRQDHAVYNNALDQTGFRPLHTAHNPYAGNSLAEANSSSSVSGNDPPPRPRWSWNRNFNYSLAHRPPVEETSGIEVWIDYSVMSMASTIGIVALVWIAASAIIWLLNVSLLRRRRVRGLAFKWTLVALASVLIVVQAFRTRTETKQVTRFELGAQQRTATGAFFWTKSSVKNTDLRFDDLERLAHDPTGEQQLAVALLRAAPSGGGEYLGIEATPAAIISGSIETHGGFLRLWSRNEYRWTLRPEFGESQLVTLPAGWSCDINYGQLTIRQSKGDPQQSVESFSVNLNSVGTIGLALFLTWLIAKFGCRMIAAVVVRSRRRNGKCVACGYIIKAPATS